MKKAGGTDGRTQPKRKNGHALARERMARDRVAIGKDSRGRMVSQPRPGKPKAKIDVDKLKLLAKVGCPMWEIAEMLEVSKETLETKPWIDVIRHGQCECNMSLRRKQYELAMLGDRTMLIWLGKQRLGQKDYVVFDQDPDGLGAEPAMKHLEIVFVDSDGDGRPRRYTSIDEMPDDVPQLGNGKP